MTDNHLNIGILGGGQLGRMLIQAVRKMDEGFNCIVWEPSKEGCALPLADEKIIKPYDDKDALQEFINKVDKVVLEFENIPVEIVQQIEASGKLVAPSSKVLSVVQNRVAEKTFFNNNGIPCAKWHFIDSEESALEAGKKLLYPFILKTARFGYDGKGQAFCENKDDVINNWKKLGSIPCIAEEMIYFGAEISIIGARNEKGEIEVYDAAQNLHFHSILKWSCTADFLRDGYREKGKEYLRKAMEALDIVGLLALEMFLSEGVLLANEMAARPHNSGHWTMDGAKTSQFEQCIRAATGMDLGSCEQTHDIIMLNLLGDEINSLNSDDLKEIAIACDELYNSGDIGDIIGVHNVSPIIQLLPRRAVNSDKAIFHDYEKTEAREGRKMGHINYINEKFE